MTAGDLIQNLSNQLLSVDCYCEKRTALIKQNKKRGKEGSVDILFTVVNVKDNTISGSESEDDDIDDDEMIQNMMIKRQKMTTETEGAQEGKNKKKKNKRKNKKKKKAQAQQDEQVEDNTPMAEGASDVVEAE